MTLLKKTSASFTNFHRYIVKQAYHATQPFKQSPPQETVVLEGAGKVDRLQGNELFSHFTADIIKENVTFTR